MARHGEDEGRAVGGEHELPLEHTARVRAQRGGEGATTVSSGVDRSQKARRRTRDANAERRAVQAVIALFIGFGGLGFLALNLSGGGVGGQGAGAGEASGGAGGAGRSARGAAGGANGASGVGQGAGGPSLAREERSVPPAPRRPTKGPARQSTAALDEVPDLPALRLLERDGLTAGAEGIPKVETDAPGDVAGVAGLEACRFAYGVWEFSPNQTFRFISTCRGLGRLELVGAYEVRDARVHLSELAAGRARWTGVFEVEKPSTMKTQVMTERPGGAPVKLDVTQRITVVRGGLHGEDFRNGFKRKNRLAVPSSDAPDRAPAPSGRSPLEQLLEP